MSDPIMDVNVQNFPEPVLPIPEGQKLVNFNDHGEVAPGASNLFRKIEVAPFSLQLLKVMVSAPGKARFEISIGDASIKAVLHVNPAHPNAELDLSSIQGRNIPSGANVDVHAFNLDEVAQHLYSSIVALEK